MDELSWFWSGAVTLPVGGAVEALAARGGLASAEALAASDLVTLGVAEPIARRWRGTRPLGTRGVALTLVDPRYPTGLRALRRPPPVLFVEGSVDALGGRGLGVVGTRACTAYGRGVARHLGHAAAAAGLVVVSGLARGVDGEAHGAAAEVGLTVAVLGHGLDHTAPPHHRRLRARIVERGGAVVSTWPDPFGPQAWCFPRRNRWIAGLSEVVVVVEAGERSGALITAREALAEGRDVAAVPGPLGAPASAGCLALLADGATPVVDVERFVADLVGGVARPADAWLADLFTGVSVDEVARRHGRSAAELIASLTRLELEGSVVRQAGGRYAPGGRSVAT